MGTHKRDIRGDRVEKGKEAQEEAQSQFPSAFDEFLAVSKVDMGELKSAYDRIQDAFDRSEKRAKAVWDRIDSVKSVSKVLFREWEKELVAYTNQDLRQSSEDQMNQTRIQYLKHNLNAKAIAAVNRTSIGLRDDVDLLIQQMFVSIEESNAFIAKMRASG